LVSANVAALAEGGLKPMLKSKLTLLTIVLLAALGAAGVAVLGRAAGRADDPAPRVADKERGPAAAGRDARPATLTLRHVVLERIDGPKLPGGATSVLAALGKGNFGFQVAKDATITDGGKAVRLADLKKGTVVRLQMGVRDNVLVAVSIAANEPAGAGGDVKNGTLVLRDYVLRGAHADRGDASRRMVIASVGNHQLSYYLAKDAKITEGGKEVIFTDLKPGALVTLHFTVRDNMIQIIGIAASGQGKGGAGGKAPLPESRLVHAAAPANGSPAGQGSEDRTVYQARSSSTWPEGGFLLPERHTGHLTLAQGLTKSLSSTFSRYL
jgi:hypothetical protein